VLLEDEVALLEEQRIVGRELLTAGPDGWSFERLAFPLSFVPDLGLDPDQTARLLRAARRS